MALTNKLGAVIDCGYNSDGMPDPNRLESAKQELFEIIKNSGLFPKEGRLLDIGSAKEGSDLVNKYCKKFPDISAIYLDFSQSLLREIKDHNKQFICANAVQMPFKDEFFDITHAQGVISAGILRNHPFFGSESYLIAKEAYRVLKPGGWFIFNYSEGDNAQTGHNLSEIEFREAVHLQRVIWAGLPHDVYAVRK